MKIIHTADLHIGQILYQTYDRTDEHEYFFSQLIELCKEENPDALIVSGDVFDIQQPSASVKRWFTERFVALSTACPGMRIVITAGNHDSASRLEAESALWQLANISIIGRSPSPDLINDNKRWQDNYIIKLNAGFIIALPYISSPRTEIIQSILDRVESLNKAQQPVIMMAHLAVVGSDFSGHDIEIGNIRSQEISSLGSGYDYLALGHIHKPQTLLYAEDSMKDVVECSAPVARYSGSVLHVSCDETYPHTISIVEVERHNGTVRITQKRIRQLRHFFVLPSDDRSFMSEKEALSAISDFMGENSSGYFRLKFDYSASVSSNFSQMVYDLIAKKYDEIRYNPKIIWTGDCESDSEGNDRSEFEISDFQEMKNPSDFILRTIDQYPGLTPEMIKDVFQEIENEITLMDETEKASVRKRKN